MRTRLGSILWLAVMCTPMGCPGPEPPSGPPTDDPPPQTSCGLLGTNCTVTAGALPTAVAAADLNGDGQPDLAVANFGANTVTILLNQPGSGLTKAGDLPVGSNPFSLTAGDLDGDGFTDLVVTGAFPSQFALAVLYGHGDGTFAPTATLPLTASATFVTSADLDGDQDLDVITANALDNSVSVLLNLDTPGAPAFADAVNLPVGREPVCVAAADLDGDGHVDLAVVCRGEDGVSILRNLGNADFAVAVSLPTGSRPSAIAAADFDGDLDIDLAVTNEGQFADSQPDTVSILLNAGNGTFTASTPLAVGVNPKSIVAADLTGNGLADLAAANYGVDSPTSGVAVLLNNGTGAFGPAVLYTAGRGPQALAAVEFENDLDIDLVVTNLISNDLSLLANDSHGGFSGGP